MALTEKQLGQLRPANTTAASLYSPGAGVIAIIKTIYVCNTSASTAKFRIFLDDDGTTYTEATALFWDTPIASDTTVEICTFVAMNNSAGNLAFRTDTASVLTATVFGAEIV